MTIRNTYAAEAWDKVYTAFQQINFTAYDYDTVKESLLQYLRIYHAEHFNDFIESSELIAVLELFAYVAELLAYRVDTMAHENFITTAQRKQSILRLARLISYTASRNIPARGLVKITSIRTSEQLFDSLGNNLANTTINWNDPNNTNWKEQFFLVINKVMTSRFGQPSKSAQVGDVLMQSYTFNNQLNVFRNGVFSFTASGANEQLQMEVVPADLDENGPFERAPDLNAQFNIIYASDGKGDGSDFTGFLMFVKQGTLIRTDYSISEPTANRRLELEATNINDTDVWVYRVNDDDVIQEVWRRVETLNEQNLFFNDLNDTRKKYEVETLENDRIALIFGDGNLSDPPVGQIQVWTRTSVNQNVFVPKNRIADQQMSFTYLNQQNNANNCSITFSLTSALQNNSPSETIEQVRQAAPATYYAQNRMVNGQDYNTYMLKDPTILRLKTINRTFAGQPKYIEWNDASRRYENTKLFGDDLIMFTDVTVDAIETRSSSRNLVDGFIEPLLQTNAVFNTLVHALATSPDSYGIITYPRRKFIEDNRLIYFKLDGTPVTPYGEDWFSVLLAGDGSLNEKTVIQAALDQHWYGESRSFATINGIRHAVIPDPILNPEDDGKIYQPDLPRTIDGVNTYPPGDVGSGLQQIAPQKIFGLRFNPFLRCFGGGDINLNSFINTATKNPDGTFNSPADEALYNSTQAIWGKGDGVSGAPDANGLDRFRYKKEVITIEMTSDNITFTVVSNLRGQLPSYVIGNGYRWSDQHGRNLPFDFSIDNNPAVAFETGDGFVVDIYDDAGTFKAKVRQLQGLAYKANFAGWWEVVPNSVMTATEVPLSAVTPDIGFANLDENGPDVVQQMTFNQNIKANSWILYVARIDDGGETIAWRIYHRNMKTMVESKETKFWYNQDDQIIDPETKKVVVDKIRILRSNLDEFGRPLFKADLYDVQGFSFTSDGTINFNQLEVAPSDTINFTTSGDGVPDNILQFENFSQDSYQYGLVNDDDTITWLACGDYKVVNGYDIPNYDEDLYDTFGILYDGVFYAFEFGNSVGSILDDQEGDTIVRRRMVPAPTSPIADNNDNGDADGCNLTKGLDFMWQHFSPVTNLVDPSVTNIHDAFLMTRGYYTAMIDYIRGLSNIEPLPPTPLELRTSYGYLLRNKMLSDTVVLHPGKLKLLFGEKADQRLRAKFRIVKAPNASFSDERIKQETISVIDNFFNIQNWDFGDTFYATELISLIHQRLATQISSVVIVPTYSVNSFGSLFTIESGFDEILQSAATVNDVEIVDALTPTVLRQIR